MFYLEQGLKIPYYKQIYHYLRSLIENGTLAAGCRLTSVRAMAEELHISRNTVERAYEQLCAEGYLDSRMRSCYLVRDMSADHPDFSGASPLNLECGEEECAAPAAQTRVVQYDLACCVGTPSQFPKEEYLCAVRQSVDSAARRKKSEKTPSRALNEALLALIRLRRGVHGRAGQIVLCAGLAQALSLIADLVPPQRRVLAMEEPGSVAARHAFLRKGFRLLPIPLTEDGVIDIAALEKMDAGAVFLTPSHQIPMGGRMTLAQRQRVLRWAQKNDAYIIECDSDGFFSYHCRPLPSIQSLDNESRVFYVSTMEPLLYPCISCAYLLVPEQMMERRRLFSDLEETVPPAERYFLEKFIAEGAMERYLRKLSKENMKKQDLAAAFFKQVGGIGVQLGGIGGGTYLTLRFADGSCGSDRAAAAAAAGVRLRSTEKFYAEREYWRNDTLLLGWGLTDSRQLEQALHCLAGAWWGKEG